MLKQTLILLGLVSIAVTQELNVKVNNTLVKSILKDWNQFHKTSKSTIKSADKDFQTQLNDTLTNAQYDVLLNYAKVVQPIANSYAEFIKSTNVDPRCNQTCITKVCFNPQNWAMNWACVQRTCQCTRNYTAMYNAEQNMKTEVGKAAQKVIPWVQEIESDVQEAYRAYRMKIVQVTQDAKKIIQNQMETTFAKCDQVCFRQCNQYFGNDIFKYSACALGCACENQSLIKVTGAM